jgi:hypothetical protein
MILSIFVRYVCKKQHFEYVNIANILVCILDKRFKAISDLLRNFSQNLTKKLSVIGLKYNLLCILYKFWRNLLGYFLLIRALILVNFGLSWAGSFPLPRDNPWG